MKNIIIVILVLLQGISFGQERPCVNNVSTNPDAPTNSNLPNDNLPLIPYDSLFLNNFNWIPVNQTGTLSDIQTIGLPALGANQAMRSLYDNAVGINDFYQYINDEVVMTTNGQGGFLPNHQNGWELIGVNLGFFPDGTAYTDIQNESNKYPTFPYVILYHRYLSKIRVFANIHDEWALGKAYNAARIRLSLNSGEQHLWNGLFRLQDGTDRSLDQETEVLSIGALAAAPNDKQRWIIADFTVAYDPCICDFSSAFNLDIELIENINFELYGRAITTTEDIVDANGEFVETDFFGNFAVDFENKEEVNGGFVMYKRMADMFDDYIKRMEHHETELANVQMHNAKVKANLAVVRWAKYAVEVGVVAATGGGSVAISLMSKLALFAPEVAGSDASKIPENWKKVVEAAEKILGAEVMTYVNDNFKEKDLPKTPEKPTANFTEMYFQGNLRNIDPKNGPTIYTPGTYGNSITNDLPNQHFYPVYNEALGIFAMLESPKIKVSHTREEKCIEYWSVNLDQVPCDWSNDESQYNVHFITRDNTTQIKLNEDLKYTFNPALKIKNYDIKASFDVRGGFKIPLTTLNVNQIDSYEYSLISNLPQNNANIESSLFDVKDDFMIKNSTDLYRYYDTMNYNTPFVPIDALNNVLSSFSYRTTLTHPENWDKLFGDLNNLNCSGIIKYANSLYNSCEGMSEVLDKHVLYYEQREVYLKLLVNVTYEGEKSDGSTNEYTYVYSYKINDEDIEWDLLNELSPNLPGSTSDFTQYPENLFLDGVDFNGSQVDGCQLNGSTYTCNAWNDITLSGVFSVGTNYEVLINAGHEVIKMAEAITPPEMVFQITILDYSDPMPLASQTYVNDFCGSDSYSARSSNMPIFNNDSTIVYEEDRRDIFAFNIFPNPTSGSSTVSITLNEAVKGELFITDMNGRTLATAFSDQTLRGGKTEHQLPTASLASGIYLVHLFVDGERHVKRLVKQ